MDQRKREVIKGAELPGLAAGDLQIRLALTFYVTQPGGSVEEFLVGLKQGYGLPGFAKGEHGTLSGALKGTDLEVRFPVTRSFTATKKGATTTYHYTVYRAAQESPWELKRAWRTDKEGNLVEELPLETPPSAAKP